MASSTPAALAAPAIPDEEFLGSLQKHCFNERMIETPLQGSGFGELRNRSHQICFVADFAREMVAQELSVNQLARAFEYNPARVKMTLANRFKERKSRSGHSSFDDDSEGDILTLIEARASKSRLVIRTDIRPYCQTNYSRPVARR
jgi:hypothetical protein